MKTRVEAAVDFDISGMWISTFHSMCVRILRIDGDRIGYSSGFSIYDSSDSLRVIKHVLEEMDLKDDKEYAPKLVRSAVSKYKNSEVFDSSPEKFADESYPFISYRFEEIFDIYSNKLKAQNAMDFDDLLLNTYRLFSENSDVLERYQKRFRYILVDEYQDTNEIQYRLVKMLSMAHRNIFVVGDDDQSIYAFRGANITNILNFEHDFQNAKKISLEQNYRSDVNILNVANSIIRNNSRRNNKTLWSEINGNGKPKVYHARNEYDEADYVVREIVKLSDDGVPYSDMAVFFRANYLSRIIEERLRGNNIPYRVYGGVSFYDKAEIKDITAYLTLMANPDSDMAFLRTINVPKRGIGPVTVQKITDTANKTGMSLYEACKVFAEDAPDKIRARINEYISVIEKGRNSIYEKPAHEIIEDLISDIDYYEMMQKVYYDDYSMRRENVEEFINSAYNMESDDEELSLFDFLQNVTLVTDMDTMSDDGVSVMTIHAAKGLEFDTVFIIGMNEEIFPNQKAVMEGDIEEERRLCYVAVTRAKRNLYMIGAKTRTLFGKTTMAPFSEFLDEIDDGLVETEGDDFFDRPASAPKKSSGINDIFLRTDFSSRKQSEGSTEDFREGMTVSHKSFGRGVIKSISGKGNYTVAVIDFDTAGQKKMFLSMAPLTVVEE